MMLTRCVTYREQNQRKTQTVLAMPPVQTWNQINLFLDTIDWSEFFDMIDENENDLFQTLGRS